MNFIGTKALAGLVVTRPDVLRAALAIAIATGLSLVALRIARQGWLPARWLPGSR